MKKSKYRIRRVFFARHEFFGGPKITYKQLKEILNQGGYFLFRYYWGGVMAVNAKVGLLSEKRKDYEPNSKTPFVSYRKCSIDEYVCNKKLEYGVR